MPLHWKRLKACNSQFLLSVGIWGVYVVCQILSKSGLGLQLLVCHISLWTRARSYTCPPSQRLVKTLAADAPLTAVDFTPDGAALAIGSSRGKIYQYDLRMLKSPVKTVSAHKTSVQCIIFQYSTALSKVKYFLFEFLILPNKCSSEYGNFMLSIKHSAVLLHNHFYIKAFNIILIQSHLILGFKTINFTLNSHISLFIF